MHLKLNINQTVEENSSLVAAKKNLTMESSTFGLAKLAEL